MVSDFSEDKYLIFAVVSCKLPSMSGSGVGFRVQEAMDSDSDVS